MRACMLFVTGLLVGFGLHTVAAQSENRGLVQMNHVGINVPNLDEAVRWAAQCPAANGGSVEVRPLAGYMPLKR